MKRILWVGVAAVLALGTTGVAVAAKRDRGTNQLAFAATAAKSSATTRTCTGADGSYAVARTRYVGTVSSGLYNGHSVVVRLKSTLNTTKGAGLATGKVWIRSTGGKLEARANLVGVIAGNTLSGVLRGRDVRGADRGLLFANYSATLGADSLALTVGSGAAANDAVLFGGTGCKKKK